LALNGSKTSSGRDTALAPADRANFRPRFLPRGYNVGINGSCITDIDRVVNIGQAMRWDFQAGNR
jgi:hypothetical protein